MKSRQLLSVVLSLVILLGVSAGSAFAQTDDADDNSIDVNDIDDTIVDDETDETDETNETDEVTETDDDVDYVPDGRHYDLDDRLNNFCDMTDEEKRQFFEDHPRLEQFSDLLAEYCGLPDYTRDGKMKDFIRIHITDEDRDRARDYVRDHVWDENRNVDEDFRHKLARWCEMSDEDKDTTAATYDKTEDQIAKANSYCDLDETDRAAFISEHRDEFIAHMKDRMNDKMSDKRPHMDYDRICALSESDRAAEITDSAKLDRLSEWCNMTPEEREDFKRDHKDSMKDHMKGTMMDKATDRMNMADISPRLKAMIMEEHDISDERMDEIKMKFKEKHGDWTDAKKSELKMKYREHMSTVKVNLTEERKLEIHDRIAEMKAFKADLRERASSMTDEEKQELRADFIEKAKDMHLAWISPRTQMTAGLDAADVECREGFSLVMKASNGVAMCLKADTALKMIDRGIVVPSI